jgi:hypothetical protein
MIDVVTKKCEYKDCSLHPAFGYENSKPQFCKKHKLEKMIDVKTKRCDYNDCNKYALYNIIGEKAKYCFDHKEDNMINVNSSKCIHTDCTKQPSYNIIGQVAKYCSDHKIENMIDVRSKKCIISECNKQPTYGLPNEKPTYCKNHKLKNMINIKCKTCIYPDCTIQPCYGLINGKPLYCLTHKLDDMIDIINKNCCYKNCTIRANFNYIEESRPLYCFDHKLINMIDVTHKKCNTLLCDIRANLKYQGYCFRCFIYIYPDHEISKNFKSKELTVVDYIKNKFSNLSWISDKKIYDSCSNRRPDLFLDLGYQVIIVEIDEDQHKGYNCENKRLMEISQDINHRPLIFIRFNPDSYLTNDKIKIKSCWKLNKLGLLVIDNETEWTSRLHKLKNEIKYWLKNNTNKIIELVELFYDCE